MVIATVARLSLNPSLFDKDETRYIKYLRRTHQSAILNGEIFEEEEARIHHYLRGVTDPFTMGHYTNHANMLISIIRKLEGHELLIDLPADPDMNTEYQIFLHNG